MPAGLANVHPCEKEVIRADGFRVEGAQARSPCSAGRTVTQYAYMGASDSGTNCIPKNLVQRLRLRGMAGGDYLMVPSRRRD